MSIEREIDKLGRLVLPMNFRKHLNLIENTTVRIRLENNSIIITPAHCSCAVCGKTTDLHKEKPLCKTCIQEIKQLN